MSVTVEEIFRPLNGRIFDSRAEAEAAISREFRAHRDDFDPDYTLYQLLQWSYRQGWIERLEDGQRVRVTADADQFATF